MKWFKRRPKRLRFPHGVPRVPIPPPPAGRRYEVCLFPEAAGEQNADGWKMVGHLPSGSPVYIRPVEDI